MNLRKIHTIHDLTFATRGQEVFVRPEADNDPVEGHDTSRAATLDRQVNYTSHLHLHLQLTLSLSATASTPSRCTRTRLIVDRCHSERKWYSYVGVCALLCTVALVRYSLMLVHTRYT